jgi:uncharacterized membrane protein
MDMVNQPHSVGTRLDRISHLSQRSRRVLAVATLLGMPAAFAWSTFWLSTSVTNVLWGPVTFLLFGVTLGGALVLYAFVRRRADLPGPGLDERQRHLRDQAWILSYQVLSAVVIFGVAWAGLAVWLFGKPITIDAALANALVLCMAVLLPVLPTAALAWIEPDPIAEEG